MWIGFTVGSREETVFYLVLALASFFFILAELVWAFRKKGETRAQTSALWTLIPAVVLVLLCFVNRHPGKAPGNGNKVAAYALRK